MQTRVPHLWRMALSIFLLFSLLAPALPAPAAAPNILPVQSNTSLLAPPPGLNPVATDPLGDMTEPNLDLHRLWVWQDDLNFYIAFDAYASNWGMAYGIYIDTDQVSESGATSDPWSRAVDAVPEHRPEYTIYVWHMESDEVENAQLNRWTGSAWTYDSLVSQGGAQTYLPADDYLEYRVPKAALGNPENIAIEVFTTGGGGSHAQDTVPSDPNVNYTVPDWGPAVTTLSAFYIFPPEGINLTVLSPTPGYFSTTSEIEVSGSVVPAEGAEVVVDVNGESQVGAVVDAAGSFSATVTLRRGENTLTITASAGSSTAQAVRTVFYGASHDENILWDYLKHDSRDPLYRSPLGAVTTGTPVRLRFRAASGDLTSVRVRVWNDRTDTQMMRSLTLAVDDGDYEWWETTLPASPDPTVYWYRFILNDGSKTVYYEDDSARTGGLGQPFDSSADNSWQLTIYDPDFYTPDWVKNAVIYQIFPDRFRDGDPSNNTPAGSFFYDEAGGTIYRSNTSEWNTTICDPRQTGTDCAGSYSRNFYGGDLQGILDKLDYLVDLGVTAIYMNPIFESPSNHKYDTTDFSIIDDNFGDLELFELLAEQANARGISLILDGVFNHSSSDSIYFDRYGRYDELGACESPASPYRDWFYFTDVTPGSGTCAGSDGTPNAANYESWWGYDSLPKMQAHNPEVRDLIWSGGEDSIARYWVQISPNQRATGWRLDVAGDVDPGVLSDPNNTYWEGFRQAVRETNPEGYIVGEEWGYANSWILGSEWDASMNYLFSTAVLGFWRDTPFYDNDHNDGSSAGPILPLTPSAFHERILNLQERYPPEAFYAMMNLLGSHDTNRALFMLDHNADQNNNALYQNPNYDWMDAIERLKGVALLQLTLPGAPTIYYGDEVGLVGPPVYSGGKWEDDPYNRQPYPWLDETGTPFYTHLQTEAGQAVLLDHYKLLTSARNSHPALRTGSLDLLLADDDELVYAYGRKLANHSDAALILVNRSSTAKDITVDLSGYLPYGAVFSNALGMDEYIVSAAGMLTVNAVPARGGAVLVSLETLAQAPEAVTDLSAQEGPAQVILNWTAAAGADSYIIYRSLLSGGGYTFLANTADTTYTDSGVENSRLYYYIVISQDDSTGLVSGSSNEAAAMPHLLIGWANLQYPDSIMHTIGLTPTENIYGQVYIESYTDLPGATPGLSAQIGYGPSDTPPAEWTNWTSAAFNVQVGNNDEYSGQLLPEETGSFAYLYRYSTTAGRDWVYADRSGPIDGSLPAKVPGQMTVLPSEDSTAPLAPQNLRLEDWSASFLLLAWDAVEEDDTLYAYDLYRSTISGTLGTRAARVLAPQTTYPDNDVETGQVYYYQVQAVDTSFNRSDLSNTVEAVPQAKQVAVTFRVAVPDYTPGTVYVVGDASALSNWNPGALPMTEVAPNVWERTIELPDGLPIQYKYTRGSWDTVEWWGTIRGFTNRAAVVDYGEDGTQVIDNTSTDWGNGPDDDKAVRDWRDPIVVSFNPADGETGVPIDTTIRVTWSHTMTLDTTFTVTGPAAELVAGSFQYNPETYTTIFTPEAELLPETEYQVLVQDQWDGGEGTQQVPASFTFTTAAEQPVPTVSFSTAAYVVGEFAGLATITVQLSAASFGTITVQYAAVGGTAQNEVDYRLTPGTLTFAAGETSASFTVEILDNSVYGGIKTVELALSNPVNASLGSPSTATLTILEDETEPVSKTMLYLPLIFRH